MSLKRNDNNCQDAFDDCNNVLFTIKSNLLFKVTLTDLGT